MSHALYWMAGALASLAIAPAQEARIVPPLSDWCVDNFLFQMDNDLFANSDRDYTSCVRFAW